MSRQIAFGGWACTQLLLHNFGKCTVSGSVCWLDLPYTLSRSLANQTAEICLGGRYNLGSFHKSGGGHQPHSPSQFHSLKRFHCSLATLLLLLARSSWLANEAPAPAPTLTTGSNILLLASPLNLVGLQRRYCYCWWAELIARTEGLTTNIRGPGLCLSCIKCLVFFGWKIQRGVSIFTNQVCYIWSKKL